MEAIIKNALQKGMSYLQYKELVKTLVASGTNSGNDKTEINAKYTLLNDRRMKRWDKTIKVPFTIERKLKSYKESVTWLVIVESWCADGAHTLPVLHKLAELNRKIDLKIVLRDENPKLMAMFLTEGTRAIPKMIMIDNKTGEVIDTYGPQPSEAAGYVNRFKVKYGKLTPEFKEDLQHWYNNDKGQNIMQDIVDMLYKFELNFFQ
ncbi:thioredoxin family protein [Flavobacteriaceae bacterium XHP0103]|uniref:thioredoxin family protein n=1 Tax=Marixanthotalea marina TaxID=2844359 RepID=UPI00298A0721|nr:thioredoxin family protein [Marixanthotalea marina]MBU3822124.1 thioredoxin family protein [Marixanthotalea marina]